MLTASELLIGQFRVSAVFYDLNRFGLSFQGYVPPFNRFWLVSKTIDTEGCGSRQSCRIAAVLRRKDRKKSSQVKFPFFRCFNWRFSDIVLNFVDREGQKNIGVCVPAQRQPLLFQHLYLSYVLFHVLTLSPKDGRAAALYGKNPYGMSSESTALYIGITSLPRYYAEPFVMLLEKADFC